MQQHQQSGNPMRYGFTLLELSIVLVIIGLIIGGITVGADMIRSAEINSVMKDLNKYQVALNTFRLKYNALAGDMKNATAYWGTDTSGCPIGGGVGTCNGNANGIVEWSNSESYTAWSQLGYSEIISGNYNGSATGGAVGGTNAPSAQIGSGAVIFIQGAPTWNMGWLGDKNKGNTQLRIGTVNISANSHPWAGILTPVEMELLDKKHDDGLPGKGKIMVHSPNATVDVCVTTNDPDTSIYDFTVTDKKCAPALWLK